MTASVSFDMIRSLSAAGWNWFGVVVLAHKQPVCCGDFRSLWWVTRDIILERSHDVPLNSTLGALSLSPQQRTYGLFFFCIVVPVVCCPLSPTCDHDYLYKAEVRLIKTVSPINANVMRPQWRPMLTTRDDKLHSRNSLLKGVLRTDRHDFRPRKAPLGWKKKKIVAPTAYLHEHNYFRPQRGLKISARSVRRVDCPTLGCGVYTAAAFMHACDAFRMCTQWKARTSPGICLDIHIIMCRTHIWLDRGLAVHGGAAIVTVECVRVSFAGMSINHASPPPREGCLLRPWALAFTFLIHVSAQGWIRGERGDNHALPACFSSGASLELSAPSDASKNKK